jgi:hypothetical protein
MKKEQKHHDRIVAWSVIGFLVTLVIGLSLNLSADPVGDCTAGTQYCEDNGLTTINTTTTTNTNTNVNTNENTNVNTNQNTNVSTNFNNNVNSSTATSNNTNTNNNVSTSTSDSTVNSTVNQNVTNASTSNNTNTNVNTSANTNVNISTSDSNVTTDNKNVNQNNNVSDNTNRNINESNSTQTINQNVTSKAPPASAIAPSIMSYSQDLCTVGRSGAFQGQVFGFSTGATVTDKNCERLKLSKYLYDTGMKVASVSILCQDERVFKAMEMAGTPCPFKGKIGAEATLAWADHASQRPDSKDQEKQFIKQCTHELNPNRDKINKDVVGAVKVIYTTKTKTKRQCKKEFYATQ